MKIQIVTNLFYPDELAGAALFTDLALYLKERGHDVRVTTTFSYYPAWQVRPEDQGVRVRNETCRGIPVRRVAMHVPRSPKGGGRILSDLTFLFGLLRDGRHAKWTPDAVLTALPMLSQCLAQRFLYAGMKVPKLIAVQDFVVEAALELNILRAPGASPLLKSIQRWALRSARTLVTISPQMLEKLKGVAGPDRRVIMIPNWIHRSLQEEIDRRSSQGRSRESKLLFYSGNLGVKQGLPDFVTSFVRSGADWRLRIRGGGAESKVLKKITNSVSNIELGEVAAEAAYVAELCGASACLVTQRDKVGANFLPSKLLPALATGTPVLAVCESDSPLGAEVREGAFGVVIPPDSPALLRECLDQRFSDEKVLANFSKNALIRSKLYRRDIVLPLYESELERLREA